MLEMRENEPLARYVGWRIGGPARFFAVARQVDEMRELIAWARERELPTFILGGGTNILIRDGGFHGMVIRNRAMSYRVDERGDAVMLYVESGAPMAGTARRMAGQGFGGLTWAEGLPGTIGGAIYGNAGCYGGDTAAVLLRATVLQPDGDVEEWECERFRYAYRASALKAAAHPAATPQDTTSARHGSPHVGPVVLAGVFELQREDPAKLAVEMAEIAAVRRSKTPSGSSCGSSFKNPPGTTAGRLLDLAGLKGTRVGGAVVSEIHANYIVNDGGASASDVLRLTDIMRERVLSAFGIELELEVQIVGEEPSARDGATRLQADEDARQQTETNERGRAVSKKRRVGVLFGGRNSEHEVSLTSARAVMRALDPSKYDIVPIGITKTGRWLWGGDPLLALEQAADPKLLSHTPEPGVVTSDSALVKTTGRLPGEITPVEQVDVIVPILHGLHGEDGTVQGLLELANVAYVGGGVLASAVGMDKGMMKAAFAAAGLPQVPYALVRRRDWEGAPHAVIEHIEATLRYPVFTKPANAGSSVGVTKCRDRDELRAGLELAATHDRRIIVEQGINAREIEVAVLGNDEPAASICGEVVPANEWYDYADKYLEGRTTYLIPAPLDQALADRIRRMAIDAFQAIDGAGLARVDFLLERETDAVFLNEVNTLPGFTAGSMYPKLWAASGLPYPALLDRLIQLAVERLHDPRLRAAGDGGRQ